VLTKFGGGVPHTDLSESARLLETMGVKTAVQVTDLARDHRVESALLFNFPEVDAIVCIGGNDTHWRLPQVERVIAANSGLAELLKGRWRSNRSTWSASPISRGHRGCAQSFIKRA